jgi:internalin A
VKRELTAIHLDLRAQAQAGFERLDEGQRALLSRVDEQFDGLMRALTDEAKDGPRLFSFEAVGPGFWDRPTWLSQKFRVTLWCEHSRLPLPDVAGEARRGVFELDLPHEWVTRAAPYLKFLSTTLSLVLPVAASATKLALDEAAYERIERELDFGKECAGAILKVGEHAGGALLESIR